MPVFSTTSLQSVTGISFLSQFFTTEVSYNHSSLSSFIKHSNFSKLSHKSPAKRTPFHQHLVVKASSVYVSRNVAAADTENYDLAGGGSKVLDDSAASSDVVRQARRSADWKAARSYKDSGVFCEGRIEGFNGGGFLVRFFSLVGFLPFSQLSPSHSCKEPHKTIQEIAKGLSGSIISVKVIQADEENRKLIFSEKEAAWLKYSKIINVGDVFQARVGSAEDYGAFIHLRFPDGLYHLTGLVHVSEVSWDLVRDVRDILNEGDDVRVKIINIDREKSRITLSIKQLEEDPLLETLDKVIPQDGSVGPESMSMNGSSNIEPLPGLETILEELLQEDGIYEIRINRQGFEKRVVSQDLQLWLSNAPPIEKTFTLLARAGRQVQEIQLSTSLDQEGIKKAVQRALERVP